jgi:hypothetical protein
LDCSGNIAGVLGKLSLAGGSLHAYRRAIAAIGNFSVDDVEPGLTFVQPHLEVDMAATG